MKIHKMHRLVDHKKYYFMVPDTLVYLANTAFLTLCRGNNRYDHLSLRRREDSIWIRIKLELF